MDYDETDDESDYTVECPFCGKEFYDDVDQCPHCRQYVSSADFKKQVPKWVVVVIALVVVSLLIPTLAVVLRVMSGQ